MMWVGLAGTRDGSEKSPEHRIARSTRISRQTRAAVPCNAERQQATAVGIAIHEWWEEDALQWVSVDRRKSIRNGALVFRVSTSSTDSTHMTQHSSVSNAASVSTVGE